MEHERRENPGRENEEELGHARHYLDLMALRSRLPLARATVPRGGGTMRDTWT